MVHLATGGGCGRRGWCRWILRWWLVRITWIHLGSNIELERRTHETAARMIERRRRCDEQRLEPTPGAGLNCAWTDWHQRHNSEHHSIASILMPLGGSNQDWGQPCLHPVLLNSNRTLASRVRAKGERYDAGSQAVSQSLLSLRRSQRCSTVRPSVPSREVYSEWTERVRRSSFWILRFLTMTAPLSSLGDDAVLVNGWMQEDLMAIILMMMMCSSDWLSPSFSPFGDWLICCLLQQLHTHPPLITIPAIILILAIIDWFPASSPWARGTNHPCHPDIQLQQMVIEKNRIKHRPLSMSQVLVKTVCPFNAFLIALSTIVFTSMFTSVDSQYNRGMLAPNHTRVK